MKFILYNGSVLGCNIQPSFIPPINLIDDIYLEEIVFILVVEKESVFRNIVNESSAERNFFASALLVTGKGYPCLFTRQLLKYLSVKYPNIPIYGLFDCDPYGMDIYHCYKYGSRVEI